MSIHRRFTTVTSALLVAGVVLAACSGDSDDGAADDGPADDGAADDGPADDGAADDAAGTVTFTLIPDPTGIDDMFEEQIAAFEAEHPNIKIDAQYIPADQYRNSIELLFGQDEPPDVYRTWTRNLHLVAPQRGWTLPLDEFLTDEITDRFEEGTFDPSRSGLFYEDQLVGMPLQHRNMQVFYTLFYNPEILRNHGYEEPPATWGDLADMSESITDQGDGDVYGFGLSGPRFGDVGALQATAGPWTIGDVGIDLTTGKAAQAHESVVKTVDFFKSLVDTDAVMPGWETWGNNEAFTQFAQGKLAMYLGLPWHVGEIEKIDPDLEIGVAPLPSPDEGRVGHQGRDSVVEPFWAISSQTEVPEAAWEWIKWMSTPEFHEAYFDVTGLPTVLEGQAYEAAGPIKDILEIADDDHISVPNPMLRSEADRELVLAIREAYSRFNWKEAAFATIAEGADFSQTATELQSDYDAEIDNAIAQIADVDREDLVYSDWNPLNPYQP